MMEDPRLGLSIDSETASCASDLSDSQASWEYFGSPDDDPSIRMLPAIHGYLPRTPSFRSRVLRRGEDDDNEAYNDPLLQSPQQQHTPRRRRETASSWDDDTRIAQHPRAPSLRFCLTLCTLTLVLFSLTGNGAPKTGYQQVSFRRAERVIDAESINDNRLPVLNSSAGALPKSHVPTTSAEQQNHGIEATRTHAVRKGGARIRPNLAMARSGERRPVFGVAPKVDESVLDPILPIDPKGGETRELNSNWTSWLAAAALLAMLVETGYKEYRLCRTDDLLENERRL